MVEVWYLCWPFQFFTLPFEQAIDTQDRVIHLYFFEDFVFLEIGTIEGRLELEMLDRKN